MKQKKIETHKIVLRETIPRACARARALEGRHSLSRGRALWQERW
jgi:hypothetical protein